MSTTFIFDSNSSVGRRNQSRYNNVTTKISKTVRIIIDLTNYGCKRVTTCEGGTFEITLVTPFCKENGNQVPCRLLRVGILGLHEFAKFAPITASI